MFDSVMVTCPHCGVLTEVQSKAGKCQLLTYEESHVPTDIASDVSGKWDSCDECKKGIFINSSIPIYGRVWADKKGETDA